MKVLYDHQAFVNQNVGGVSRYFYELMKINNENVYLSVKYSNNEYLRNDKNFHSYCSNKNDIDHFKTLSFRGKNRLNRLLNRSWDQARDKQVKYSIKKLNDLNYDIFHPTYYDDYFLANIRKPFVLTIHDFTHELFPAYFNLRTDKLIELLNKEKLCEKAERIICISDNTKKDLINLYHVDEERIDVVYHGCSFNLDNIRVNDELLSTLPEKYILYTGSRYAYKNFYFFLKSIKELLISDKELKIVCTHNAFSNNELKYFELLQLSDKVLHKYICNDNDLFTLYKYASIFVYPSLYEGFGMPLLESFAAETPVVISNTSCFPEIAGDAAMYFDPTSKESILTQVYDVLQSTKIQEELIDRGKKRLDQFSWEKTFFETSNVYKKVLNEKY